MAPRAHIGHRLLSLCALALVSACPGPRTLPATAHAPAPQTAKDTTAPARALCSHRAPGLSRVLGDEGFLPIAPGQLPTALPPPEPGYLAEWKVVGHDEIDLGDTKLSVLRYELAGSGSGLVFSTSQHGESRVVATYALDAGGNGGHMKIAARWRVPNCPLAIVLVALEDEFRGYYAEPGNEESRVEAKTQHTWIALGLSLDGGWIASETLYAKHTQLAEREPSVVLTTSGETPHSYVLNLETLHFQEER
jgi:hypothetical protein